MRHHVVLPPLDLSTLDLGACRAALKELGELRKKQSLEGNGGAPSRVASQSEKSKASNRPASSKIAAIFHGLKVSITPQIFRSFYKFLPSAPCRITPSSQEEPQVDIMQLLSGLGASLEQWIVVQSARAAAAALIAQEPPPSSLRQDGLTSAPSSPLRLAASLSSPLKPAPISVMQSSDLGFGPLSPTASGVMAGDLDNRAGGSFGISALV